MSGTVTLLFTDIEGSTRLWEAQPGRMATVLARHDVLCREVVGALGGRVVKTTGDGLYAAFDDPFEGLSAAIELQRGIQAIARESDLALKMRCGLHDGAAETRDGDYFGPAVNCAARVMDAAHGGQVLVTQALVDRVEGRRPEGVDLLHLGRVRLRGISAPIDVWQVHHADLRRTFPPLRTLDSIPHNLPRHATSFVGRENQIDEVIAHLHTTNLLTVTGAGGCGKSRLALQVATNLLETYPDGAWFVELAALTDPSFMPHTVATVLGIAGETGVSVADALVRHLESRRLLLVLDNAEHLLDACAQLVDVVLRRCRDVKLLVSSREGLGVAGEVIYRVPSLTTPDAKAGAEQVAACEAVRLFSARAQAQVAHFAVTPQNAAAVASVCRRLDGIPLAIELAAARLRSMTVEEVDRRLDERFRLLTGGSRTALPRQQTLRSLIDWSYDLLTHGEKMLFSRLSVFSDGWTIAAAESVVAGDGVENIDVLDLLGSLVDKNLVVANERDGATRYRMLETMRQYARDRLFERRESEATRGRHLAYFRALGQEAGAGLQGRDAQPWLDRLQPELDNLRAALNWSLTNDGDAHTGMVLAIGIFWFWYVRGYFEEGRDYFVKLLAAAPDAELRDRARAMLGAGILASQLGDNDGARALHGAALAISRDTGDRMGEAMALNNIGNCAEHEGDYADAQTMYEQCVAILRELGERASVAAVLSNLANLRREAGDYDTAKAMYEEALVTQRELNDRQRIGTTVGNLSEVARLQGDFAACASLAAQGLQIARSLGDRQSIVLVLETLASLAVATKDCERAARLLGHAERMREDVGLAISPGRRESRSNELARIRASLSEPAFARAWREGRAMDEDEAIDLGLRDRLVPDSAA